MKIKQLLYPCFVLVCFAQNLPAQPPQKIRIDPAQASGGPISTFFEEVKYIPLETTKQSLFGQISQLCVTGNYFIILDYDTNSILFFTKEGKFHCRIGMGNIGKDVSPIGVNYFVVNPEQKEISFKINESQRWVYNFDGRKLREETGIMPGKYYHLPEGKTVFSYYNVRNNPADSAYELSWVKEGNTYQKGMPYAIKNTVLENSDRINKTTPPFNESGNDSIIYYTRPYDYTVYRLSADSITRPYTFVFPLDVSVPRDFLTSMAYYGKRIDFLRQHPKIIRGLACFFELNGLLFFGLEQFDWNPDNTFIYDTRTSSLFSLNHIDVDSSNYFLPLRPSIGFLSTDGMHLYTTASSLEMFAARDAAAKKKIKYSQELADYFTRGKESNNPVIVQLKPKAKLP